MWLLQKGIKTIWYPCIPYEENQTPDANNHYNCPIVTSYAENIKNNMEELRDPDVLFLNPFLALDNADALKVRLMEELSQHYDVTKEEISDAVGRRIQRIRTGPPGHPDKRRGDPRLSG